MTIAYKKEILVLLLLASVAAALAVGARYVRRGAADDVRPEIPLDPEALIGSGGGDGKGGAISGTISVSILKGLVDSRTAIVVDARLGSLFRKGHVPGAVNLPALRPSKATMERILEFPRGVTVVVYCESANCTDSKTVAKMLREKGMTNIRTLSGGWEQWLAHGLAVEKDA